MNFWGNIQDDYYEQRERLDSQMKYLSGNGLCFSILFECLKSLDDCIEKLCERCKQQENEKWDAVKEAKEQLKQDPEVWKQLKEELLENKEFVARFKSCLASKTIRELREEIKELKGI